MKISRIRADYRPSFNEMFFLDTNVWLYLYYPQFSAKAKSPTKFYSALFEKIATSPIQTNLVQMSELINAIIRAEYRVYSEQGNAITFKDYREHAHGLKAMKTAHAITSTILRAATLRSGVFSPDELKEMVLECDKADFNDIYFAHYCQKLKMTLVTHDFDFKAVLQDTKIISGNPKYS